MKSPTKIPATLLLIAGLMHAQDFGRGRGRGPGRGPGGSPILAALDTDHNGILSADEIANAPAALRTLDRDGDGQLTADELQPMRREGGPEREASRENDAGSPEDMVETLMAFDKDHDGKLSKAELPERMQGMFDRADTNHDGFLTPDEIRALAKAQAADAEPPEPRRVDPLAALLDTNHDGVISAAEIDNAPAVLRTLDKNGDGQLTQDELRPFPGRGRGNRDANGAGNQGPPIARLFPFDRLAFDQSRTAPQQTSGPAAPPERQ